MCESYDAIEGLINEDVMRLRDNNNNDIIKLYLDHIKEFNKAVRTFSCLILNRAFGIIIKERKIETTVTQIEIAENVMAFLTITNSNYSTTRDLV